MIKTAILLGAAMSILSAPHAATKKLHRGFRQTIEAGFVAHDKKLCRWDPPAAGGPACRITKMTDEEYTRSSLSGKLNGWLGEKKIGFRAVYYNGQLWADDYDAFVLYEWTRTGWQLRYSSLGDGENELSTGAASR